MKKISITFFVVTIIIIALALLVTPRIITKTFHERLSTSFVGDLSLDSLEGVNFNIFKGFTVEYIEISVADDTSNSSLILKDISLGVASNSMLRPNAPTVLSYISVDTIDVRSSNIQNKLEYKLEDILSNSIISIKFGDDFILSCDQFIWSGQHNDLHLENVELRRKRSDNYKFSFHEAQYGNSFVSNYLEIKLFGVVGDNNANNLLFNPVEFDSLFVTDSTFSFIEPIFSQFRNRIDSTSTIVNSSIVKVNKLAELILSQVEFDSLSLEKSLSTIKNSDSTLTESSHLNLEWFRDDFGDSITLSIPKVRNSKWPRIDTLFTAVRVTDGNLGTAVVAFQCDDISVASSLSFEERSDSGSLFISMINNRNSYIYETPLPFKFDTLQISADGVMRKSKEWEIDIAGSVGEASLYDYFPDSITQFANINIDTAQNCRMTVTPKTIRFNVDYLAGAFDTTTFSGDSLFIDSENNSVEGENIFVFQSNGESNDTLGSISSLTIREDSVGKINIVLDTVLLRSTQQYPKLAMDEVKSKIDELWNRKNKLSFLDSLSDLSCIYFNFKDTLGSRLTIDSLSIELGDELDLMSSKISIPSVGSISDLTSLIEFESSGLTIQSVDCGTIQLITDSTLTVDSISSIMKDVKYFRDEIISSNFSFRGDFELPIVGVYAKNIECSSTRELGKSRFEIFSESISHDEYGKATTISASGVLSDNAILLDSSRGTWDRITTRASGKINLEPNLSSTLRTSARNLKLSVIASDILSGHGTVTGYGSGRLQFSGNLLDPNSWTGRGSFLLRNVRIRGLSVQEGDLINEHAAPFKDFRMSEIVCSRFDLSRNQRLHLNDVRGSGESVDIWGWGNLSRSGYFYFEMDGKVHSATMVELPRLTRLALNERSSKDEGEFEVKLFGSPDDQRLITSKGIGGNVIRSQFRAMGASIRNIFN